MGFDTLQKTGARVMASTPPSSVEFFESDLSKLLKVAIVTGTSNGIGLELVKRLSASPYRVAANTRYVTPAKKLSTTE
jgi:hypothetical protein